MRKRLLVLLVVSLLGVSCAAPTEAETIRQVQDESSDTAAKAIAEALIVRLGSDDAAADALIIAMDRGYSGSQILDGLDAGSLRDDGTIGDQEPAGSPLELVLYSIDGEGEGASGLGNGVPALGEVQLASFIQPTQTPIERFRDAVRTASGEESGVGWTMTAWIVAMIKRGYTPADITEVIILGWDAVEVPPGRGIFCLKSVDEYYCPNGERIPVVSVADPQSDVDESDPQVTIEEEQSTETVVWSGEITPPIPDAIEPAGSILRVTRDAGTGEFEADFFLEYRSPFGVACTWVHTYSFKAQGVGTTLALPDEILFTGENVDSHIKSDCTAEWADLAGGPTNVRQYSLIVSLTEQGMAGTWSLNPLGATGFLLAPEG